MTADDSIFNKTSAKCTSVIIMQIMHRTVWSKDHASVQMQSSCLASDKNNLISGLSTDQ